MSDAQVVNVDIPDGINSQQDLLDLIDCMFEDSVDIDRLDEIHIKNIYDYLTKDINSNWNLFVPPEKAAHINSIEFEDQSSADESIYNIPNNSSPWPETNHISCSNEENNCFNDKEWLIEDYSLKKVRPPKLWEFLFMLLDKSQYSIYISWIDKGTGLFKIHEPNKVAHLWKQVKMRHTTGPMDYATFSRGIRYYYRSGLMVKTYTKHTYRFAKTKYSLLSKKHTTSRTESDRFF